MSDTDTDIIAEDVDGQDEQDYDGQENPNREAAKWRTKFREAERLLNLTRQSVVDRAMRAARLDPRLLAAGGHTVDSLVGDDGLIDHDVLAEVITTTKREFRVVGRTKPAAAWIGGRGHGETSWGKAHRDAKKR